MNDHENTTNSTETHQDLVTFLTLKSWHIRGSGALGELWENDLGRTIAVPKGITPRHFEWDGIVRRLADSEKRSASAIDLALKRLYTDVAEFRAADDTYIRGSIPVDAGYALVSAARQFMRSSATTSRSPKAHIDGKYSSAGESIAERARFAHTIDGSYILPMLVPLSRPAKNSGTLFSDDAGERHIWEPEERRATRTMAQALSAIRNRIVEPAHEPKPNVVADLVVAGVSREMVIALHSLISDESVATFDATFNWAGALAAPVGLPEKVEIPRDSADLLKRTSALMKTQKKKTFEALTGPIVQLRDDAALTFGDVNLQTVRNGRSCEVIVRLSGESLARAHQWFESREALVVEGRVTTVRGRHLAILEPTRVTPLRETLLYQTTD
jgi:hypothetical protein